VTRRYSRAQFIRDAAWLGVPLDAAFSRTELRRRRDHLMNIYHPDHGGDTDHAARLNATYTRMTEWLDKRRFRTAERKIQENAATPDGIEVPSIYKSGITTAFQAAALVALATLAAIRATRKP